jgi:hypothetical protein
VTNLKGLPATAFAGVIALGIALDLVHRETGFGQDFHTYLAAALTGLNLGWDHIYDQVAVAVAQDQLAPNLWSQPFLSPPPAAWLVIPLVPLPFQAAYLTWEVLMVAALAAALAWSTSYTGPARWIAAAAALVPWWVFHAVHVGQAAPLIAAAVLVAWRLLRQERDVAAGLVLVLVLLKPNTAVFVPVALLFMGRRKALLAWLGACAALTVASVAVIGPHGVMAYVSDLRQVTPLELRGASQLTLGNLLALSPGAFAVVRALVAIAGLMALFRYRREPGMALAAGALVSLLTTSYLHGSDLCLFLAAGWIVWHERPDPAWRALLAGTWVLATPFLDGSVLAPALNRWVLCEVAVLAAFLVDAWARRPVLNSPGASFTAWAASGRQAPA